jgi:hypothetical protein
MAEPGLQLEQRHRLLGVVELAGDGGAGAVAGDVAADIGGGDTGLGAQRRDDGVVDVDLGHGLGADREQHVHMLFGLAVQSFRLAGPQRLPRLDGLPDDRVDGLGERGAGLVHRHVEQADRVLGEDLARVAGDGQAGVLPADASDPQPGDLVAA